MGGESNFSCKSMYGSFLFFKSLFLTRFQETDKCSFLYVGRWRVDGFDSSATVLRSCEVSGGLPTLTLRIRL